MLYLNHNKKTLIVLQGYINIIININKYLKIMINKQKNNMNK